MLLEKVPTEAWDKVVGEAVFDEIQKVPSPFEKIKWAYEKRKINFSVILGSSRVLLLDKVRETLAVRIFLYELWPLTIGEPFLRRAISRKTTSHRSC